MLDVESVLGSYPLDVKQQLLPALGVIMAFELFDKLSEDAVQRLVKQRTDYESDESLSNEVREVRQTNRALTSLSEGIRTYLEANHHA